MLSREWCWVIMPADKAALFRSELAGTLPIDPDVPAVGLPPPVSLEGGLAGWCSHYWTINEAVRDQIEILATHSRYGGTVTFGHEAPVEWVPVSEPAEA